MQKKKVVYSIPELKVRVVMYNKVIKIIGEDGELDAIPHADADLILDACKLDYRTNGLYCVEKFPAIKVIKRLSL